MPSQDLLPSYQEHLQLDREWWLDGTHYEKTANAWLENTDRNRARILDLFREVYGPTDAKLWLQRWRVFFLACAEMFGYDNGSEWGVGHYRFAKL